MMPLRSLLGAVGLAAVFVAVAGDGRAQFGGFDLKNPDNLFNAYAQRQGAKDALEIDKVQSRLDPELPAKMKAYAAKQGNTTGKMTREQFADFWTKDALPRIEAKQKEAFGGFFGKGPAAPAPASPSPAPAPATPPQGPVGFGKGFGTPGEKTVATTADKDKKAPDPAGYQPRPFNEEETRGNFQNLDRDRSAALDEDEYRRSDIRREVEKWDANKNGLVEIDEYVAWAKDRHVGREEERRQYEEFKALRAAKDSVPTPVVPLGPLEPDRPVIIRADNLPEALPAWFKALDTDRDAQVGLYEWRAGQRDNAEFRRYDRNEDGLLTPDEVLWYDKNADRLAGVPPTGPAVSTGATKAGEKGKGWGGFGNRGPDAGPKRP